jgi:DNA-binding response OmpR family regulator
VSKQSLLLVDGDTRSLRVLEVSLRKAGFTVTPAASVADALEKLDVHTPDLIISETKFPTDLDGFELRRRVRGSSSWSEIPFVFLTAETAIEHKIRGLELGVDDYLTKPIYIKEIVTRINILLQKRQRAHFDERKDGVRFAGRVVDMPVIDVIQTIEVSRKSGVIQFTADRQRSAAIYFRDGKVIDAEAGTLQGEDAVYRLLTWSEGEFEVVFRTVRRREVIATSSQGLLMEGMRRLDEWSRLLEQLPPLSHRFEIDVTELAARLGEVPDDNNPILRVVDGKRSLLEVIDASDFGDLECLQAISRLYFEGLLVDLDPLERPKRDTGKPMPLVVMDSAPTPIEEVASGPNVGRETAAIQRDESRAAKPAKLVAEATPASDVEPAEATLDPLDDLDDVVPGPLMGGYRPSSLRLIDEAVAAAQAIDPSLFESDLEATNEPNVAPIARVQLAARESDPRIGIARRIVERGIEANGKPGPASAAPSGAIERAIASAEMSAVEPPPADELAPDQAVEQPADDAGVPTAIDEDADPADSDVDYLPPEEQTEPGRPSKIMRGEVSTPVPGGLRMIGSHGHDRAEASGELLPPREGGSGRGDTQRELVTILPRRITREVPAVEPPPDAVAAPAPAATALPPPRQISVEGGVRRTTGPGPLVMTLVAIGSLLLGMTAFTFLRKKPAASSEPDAGVSEPVAMHVVDSALGSPPASVDASQPIAMTRDAALVSNPAVAAGSGSAADPNDSLRRARALLEQAHDALEDGDPARARELAEESLKLRKTARTYLELARALQRLDNVDEALEAVDSAMEIVNNYAPAWDERGKILWAARRTDEARAAFQKYLELDPNGRDAASIREMIGLDKPPQPDAQPEPQP